MIDLRSDTVTKPSQGMRDAMINAPLGDDVYGEDPTVNELQQKCAELTGKETALFVPTGCMANQLAVKAHTIPGDEIICEAESHIFNYENAAPSVISHVQVMPVKGNKGCFTADDVKKYRRPEEYYFPKTRLICLENTHNRAGGTIIPFELITEISGFAEENGIKMHLDGARIFNAVVETGIPVKDYASKFDTISFCFSKGLGSPVGSILCGNTDTIGIAHRWRKTLGGGMRQAGILAAAALYSLSNNIDRLKDDNSRAKRFALALSEIDGMEVDASSVQTNIVIFESKKIPKEELISKMKDKGVLISSGSYDFLRVVFHLDISDEDLDKSIEAFKTL